jgi:hypothetical protein
MPTSRPKPKSVDITIRIDIPGLSDLVAYLREKDRDAATIDALTKRVRQATTQVLKSSTALKNAVNNSIPSTEGE